jgi:serine/threonine-protein kinase
VIEEPFDQTHASLSPDGRWIAYASNESGRYEVYVRPFPDVASRKWPISQGGGTSPLWARTGRELFYRSDEAMMVVAIETEPSLSAGAPTALFEASYFRGIVSRHYDVAPDGERFLMIKQSASEDAPDEIRVVLNWFQELERLVPTE